MNPACGRLRQRDFDSGQPGLHSEPLSQKQTHTERCSSGSATVLDGHQTRVPVRHVETQGSFSALKFWPKQQLTNKPTKTKAPASEEEMQVRLALEGAAFSESEEAKCGG